MYPENTHPHRTISSLSSPLFLPLGTSLDLQLLSLPTSSGVLAISTLDSFSHTYWLV